MTLFAFFATLSWPGAVAVCFIALCVLIVVLYLLYLLATDWS